MSDYSGYQIKRAHSLGPFTSVYEATGPGGVPGRFALKIFHPPASTSIRRAYAIEGWLLAAERQQKAAKKDGAVLEVLAYGRCPEGAYCVLPWQELPLEPFLATLAVRGNLLRALAECLLDALERWSMQTGGSHRKLKATNVFFTRSGPLQGMTAVLSDPWFQYGDRAADRFDDLRAVGAILAQLVRRREVAGWPIEDGPEWRALGRPAKAWLAYVNFLLDPQPAGGETTIAEARKRLRAIPKDTNPARTAILLSSAAVVVVAGGVAGFARFGDPIYMPRQIQELAVLLRNPKAYSEEITEKWPLLCRAWETWLLDLQNSARRLDRATALWAPNDPLKVAIANFVASAEELRPETLVPEAAGKGLGTLANATPENVRNELRKITVYPAVNAAYDRVSTLAGQFERWSRWEELRTLLQLLEQRGFTRAAGALRPRLPGVPGGPGYKLDAAVVQTFKLFNDLSLDETGALLLASRWSELTRLTADMKASGDRVQAAMPELALARLVDRSSLGAFADLLADPLEELRRRRQMFLDPQVVRERFLQESALLKETAAVTPEDFPRWEEQIALFTKVPAADDPRRDPALDESLRRLEADAVDLENEAPASEPGGVETLSTASYRSEYQARRGELAALRAKEIVRIDLPAVTREKDDLFGRIQLLRQRLDATLVLLKPETWLAKVAQAYGAFEESRRRWAAWQQAALTGVTADSLRGAANRERFRSLRRQERQIKEWIDGLEGAEGLGGVPAPNLTALTASCAEALRALEAARREQSAALAAAAAPWSDALPGTPWSGVAAAVRAPIAAHRDWVEALPAFGAELDALGDLLANGYGWTEGISDVLAKLLRRPGVDDLTGPPAEWTSEARLLGRLVESTSRAELTGAAQDGAAGLSRRLTAWRRLGTLSGWPADATELDIDGGVSARLREEVESRLNDLARKASLLAELARETRARWNRAARNSAGNVDQMSAVFERMPKYNIAETDLEPPAFYNLKLWQLKRSDWSEVDLAPLRARRDAFVNAVRGITGVMSEAGVRDFVNQLAGIELVVDPERKPTPSPRLAGWTEELTDAGLGLTATWKAGDKTVKLDFAIVQADDMPPFYLAKRALAVGEFLDLLATRPAEETAAVVAELPLWTRADSYDRPWNKPIAWRPRVDSLGRYEGFELNPSWLYLRDAQVTGLFDNPELQAATPALAQAAAEKPTARSPLQLIPPDAARLLVERMLGARLPTPAEWQAVMRQFGAGAAGHFRGASFAALWKFLSDYREGNQTVRWRPNEGVFLPLVKTEGGAGRRKYADDGAIPAADVDNRLWFTPVDEGPAPGGFVNLVGNVSIYLYDPAARQFYVAGGSALSPPGIDFTQPQKVEVAGLIGAKRVTEGFSDVGVRPAFDAPPGFKERYNFLVLVRNQPYLTW